MRFRALKISIFNHLAMGAAYPNDPKFSDKYAWANSADPDQTAPSLIRDYTVCLSVCIVWTHYSTVEPHSSHFRVITTKFLGVQLFRKFTVFRNENNGLILPIDHHMCDLRSSNWSQPTESVAYMRVEILRITSIRPVVMFIDCHIYP